MMFKLRHSFRAVRDALVQMDGVLRLIGSTVREKRAGTAESSSPPPGDMASAPSRRPPRQSRLRPDTPRQVKVRLRPPRALVMAVTLALSLATGLTLLGLAQVLTTGPATGTVDHMAPIANSVTVRAFYAAANRTLETGDPTDLSPLVAPDLVEHRGPTGSTVGRAGLVQPLVSLHAGFPLAQLVVDDLVAQADRVVARVHLTGVTPGQFAGLVLPSSLAVWGEVDVFRLVNGVIVEHWGGRESAAQLRPLQRGSLDLPYDRTAISASRLTFPPAVTDDADTLHGPALLYVEAGQLVVTIKPSYLAQHGPAVLTHAASGTPSAGDLVSLGHPVTLRTGDLLTLPEGVHFSATGGAGGPAVCLAMASVATSFATAAIHGPQVQRLANNLPGPLPSGSVAVTLGHVTLAPGVTVPLTTTTGATLMVVESGKLEMSMTAGGTWTQRGGDGTTLAIGRFNPQVAFPPTTTLAARDAAVMGAAARGVIRNTGQTPLALLVVALTPDHPFVGTPPAAPAGQSRGIR